MALTNTHKQDPRAKPTPNQAVPNKFTPKRTKIEGTSSSPLIIDSDGDEELELLLSKPKRRKLPRSAQLPARSPREAADESSDDEPLITRTVRRATGLGKGTAGTPSIPSATGRGDDDRERPSWASMVRSNDPVARYPTSSAGLTRITKTPPFGPAATKHSPPVISFPLSGDGKVVSNSSTCAPTSEPLKSPVYTMTLSEALKPLPHTQLSPQSSHVPVEASIRATHPSSLASPLSSNEGTTSPFSPFSHTPISLFGQQKNLRPTSMTVSKQLRACPAPSASVQASRRPGGPSSTIGETNSFNSGPSNPDPSSNYVTPNSFFSTVPQNDFTARTCQFGALQEPFSSRAQTTSDCRIANKAPTIVISASEKPRTFKHSTGSSPLTAVTTPTSSSPALNSSLPFITASDPPSRSRPRVPTPERVFTNMSVANVNKLILTMPAAEAEEKKRGAKTAQAAASARRGRAKKNNGVQRGVVKGVASKKLVKPVRRTFVEETGKESGDVDMADNDNDFFSKVIVDVAGEDTTEEIVGLGGTGVVQSPSDHSEGAGDADDTGFSGIDVHAGAVVDLATDSEITAEESEDELSRTPAAARKVRLSSQVRKTLQHQRTDARSRLAAKPSAAKKLSGHKSSAQKSRVSHTAPLIQASRAIAPTNDKPSTRLFQPSNRKRGSLISISQEEASAHVSALTAAQDAAPDAFPRIQKPQPKSCTPASQTASTNSPYGRISASRFKVFKAQLFEMVSEGLLFANEKNEDTLGRCLSGLNRGLRDSEELSLVEISAAFVHLKKIGHFELEGDRIRYVGED